jgi:hypothetical protein
MEELQTKVLTDQMLRQCRKIIPVTRKMNEADEAAVLDCYQKYLRTLNFTSQVLVSHFSQQAQKD